MLSFWDGLEILLRDNGYIIDRPKGTKHPKYDYVYEVDYGYIKDTTTVDNGGIDIWVGCADVARINGVICTVDLIKKDAEIKVIYRCTDDEIIKIKQFHNYTNYMKSIFIPYQY